MGGEAGVQNFKLAQGWELRIEDGGDGGGDGRVEVKLLEGSAEIFGTEIAPGQTVDVSGMNVAVYTFHGAHVEVRGSPSVVYESDETPMLHVINVHSVLDKYRTAAKGGNAGSLGALASLQPSSSGSKAGGPRTLLAGPTDAGKSTLTRILANYAVRTGFKPLLVDLDIGQGMVTVPGAVTAVPVDDVADVKKGFPQESALTFFFGHTTPSENPDHYRRLVERLASLIDAYLTSPANTSGSGIFVNTMGWIDGMGYDLLRHAIDVLKIDVVVVIGHDRLYSQLRGALQGKQGTEVVKIPKSGGVVSRDSPARKAGRERRVHSYFYGPIKELSPFSRSVPLDVFQIFKVGGGPKVPQSALPIGSAASSDPLRLTKVNVTRDLTHSLLAVSHAKDPEDILATNVAGFIHVLDVDLNKHLLTYLAPCVGNLPSTLLLCGGIKVFLK